MLATVAGVAVRDGSARAWRARPGLRLPVVAQHQGQEPAGLPANAYATLGAGSNTIVVSPDHDLVIVCAGMPAIQRNSPSPSSPLFAERVVVTDDAHGRRGVAGDGGALMGVASPACLVTEIDLVWGGAWF